MYLALIKKELRELLPTAAVAAGAYLLLFASTTDSWVTRLTPVPDLFSGSHRTVVFASIDYRVYFSMISIGFVSVLGFQQAITEEWRGTYKLLLHRPLDRRAIFFAKAAAGLGLYLLLGTLSILAVAVWAATPGMQPAPFFWSMTLPTFGALLAITMVYLGAFVSGLRPARWYATRLFPWLVSVVLCYLVLAGIFAVPMLVLGLGLLVANFLVIATTREFA